MQTTQQQIDTLTKELVMRQIAARNLRSMAQILNQSQIDRLYDRLNHLHIQRIEEDA